LTPIEYCSKLLNNKDPSMVQMYWTQTPIINRMLDREKLRKLIKAKR